MRRELSWIWGPLLALAACSQQPASGDAAGEGGSAQLTEGGAAQVELLAAADLPAGVRAAVLARMPEMKIMRAERKERGGMIFYDVEGTGDDGNAIELDVLHEAAEFRVVEVQRDIDWAEAPEAVIAAAKAAPIGFVPVRVIESIQNDGTVIFELFAPDRPKEPAAEIDWKDGKAAVRRERNIY